MQKVKVSFVSWIVCSERSLPILVGPEGYGPGKMVAKSRAHSYMVRFENDPEFVTAPAQVVRRSIIHWIRMRQPVLAAPGDFGFAGMTFCACWINVLCGAAGCDGPLGVVVDDGSGM